MLRYLTHKLRTQSLNESEPYKTDDDRDSGTESDDEGADIEELQKYMESLIQLESRPRVRKFHHHHNQQQQDSLGVENEVTTRACRAQQNATTPCGRSNRKSPSGRNKRVEEYPALVDSALPSDSDHNLDVHSSEEELEVINCVAQQKRKWREDDASLADDAASPRPPLRFRTSPPAHAHRPGGAICVRHLPPHELCSVSPRKRYRRTQPQHAIHQQRPCLDFEKMQQINRVRLL